MITEIIPSQHTDSVLCCEVHPSRNLLISGDEDGCLCFTDLTTRSPLGRLRHGNGDDAIPSVSYNPTDEHSAFAAVGSSILRLDLRKNLGEEAIVDTFRINTDEINSIDVDSTGSWIAAGDDSGEVQIISLKNFTPSTASKASPSPQYRTLRRGHTNICNAVSFRPSRTNEILSGGLDCRMVRWDFTKLRQLTTFDMNASAGGGFGGDGGESAGGQFFNPPMINCLAVCHESDLEFPSLVAVARGDGCVALYNGDAKATATAAAGNSASGGGGKGSSKSSSSSKSSKKQQSSGSDMSDKDAQGTSAQEKSSSALIWAAGTHHGGHTAAVNCVSFLRNTAGKKLISVGNDRKVLLWDWQNSVEPVGQLLHRAKINWVCSSGSGSSGGGKIDAVMGDVAGKLVAVTFKE
jgi:WD40 repeat protein